jgi:hypothetical protein
MFPADLNRIHIAMMFLKKNDISIISNHLPKKSGIPWNSSEKVLFFAVFLQVVASTSCGIPMATRWAPAPVAAASPTRPGKHGDTATRPRRHQESENHGFFWGERKNHRENIRKIF